MCKTAQLLLALVVWLGISGTGSADGSARKTEPGPVETSDVVSIDGHQSAELDLAADLKCDPALRDELAAAFEPAPMAGCSVQTTCFGGAVVSCTGDVSCINNGCAGVMCDGVPKPCTCGIEDCANPGGYCACRCGQSHFFCFQQHC